MNDSIWLADAGHAGAWARIACVALFSVLLLATSFCGGDDSPVPAPAASADPVATPVRDARDVHSAARPEEARVTHVALDLRADFAAHTLAGTATLSLEVAPGAQQVILDTQDLTIESVTEPSGKSLVYALDEAVPIIGRPLRVTLPAAVRTIVVRYSTSPEAGALQWLEPAQTAGKRRPYLFSQGEAILTRTWIPTQDSPGIRQTYAARIVVPRELKALMSAEQLTPDGVSTSGGRAFEFKMTQPVAPYLIALAVGDIAFKAIGPRTGVYTEPALLDAAASEFADLEKMVETAESLGGPYRWGRYDVLVLPPSFPFGGMENPRLTFATPTIIAGDRSLVSLIAHELAHSWSGNLVTNATWSDFWLNEGFTTYLEGRIVEQLYGVERARMLELLGRRELQDEIKKLGATSGETVLHVNLAGRNPDDGATSVPYEKGAAFLRTIEQAAGRSRFDAYLRSYFDRHAFKSITTADFVDDLQANLLESDPAIAAKLRIDEWLYKPGLPADAPVPVSDAFVKVEAQVEALTTGTPAAALATTGWSTQEWQHFLQSLPRTLTNNQLFMLDRAFRFTDATNSEVLFDWLRVAIRNNYAPARPALERFLTSQGRRKFVRPLFEDLMRSEWGQQEARRIYPAARPLYHSVTAGSIDQIVK